MAGRSGATLSNGTRALRTIVMVGFAITVCTAVVAVDAPRGNAGIIGGAFTATPPAFSPNGDGQNDTTRFAFTLSDTAASLSLIVFASDSITPVDTLIAPAAESQTGAHAAGWNGLRYDGMLAPEGAYIVSLTARPFGGSDTTVTVPVFVDLTPPVLSITGVSPAVYAPGLAGQPSVLTVTFHLAGVSPPSGGRPPDELQPELIDPTGVRVADADIAGRLSFEPALPITTPPSVTSNGDYSLLWAAQGQPGVADGTYRVVLTAVDAAGFASFDTVAAVVDVFAPTVHFTNIAGGAILAMVPDSLRGFAADVGGVDSLFFRFGSTAFSPIPVARISGDTTFFAVFLTDSVTVDSTYSVSLRAVDAVGRPALDDLQFTLDTTAPLPPALDPFTGAWHAPEFPLAGEAPPEAGPGGIVRAYNNGVFVDSVLTITSRRFSLSVPLAPGQNRLTARYVDVAGNTSIPSNAIDVPYDTGAGLFLPVPFTPGDSFQFIPTAPTNGAEIRIYDLSGQLVIVLQRTVAAATYEFSWNGRNADGVGVDRGPLVAVAIARGQGSGEPIRRIFLFDPGR